MMEVTFDRQKGYRLLTPLRIYTDRIEVYFSEYSDEINHQDGFLEWYKSAPDEVFIKKGRPVPEPTVANDFSEFKYRWNVLTPMDNGIVLTNDPNNVENGDSDFHPLTLEDIRKMNDDLQAKIQETNEADSAPTTEEKIAELENAIADLRANQK